MKKLKINFPSRNHKLKSLTQIGALKGGGNARIALTDEDKMGRDQVCRWMKDLGLKIHIDQIGNIIAIRAGSTQGPIIMMGSHIDTVATGGHLDGCLGVLAGLEVISHNINEYTHNEDIEAGANVLLQAILQLSQ